VELLLEGDCLALVEGIAEHRRCGLERRERQVEDALDGCGGEADSGRAEASVEQELRHRPAERVAHDDRRRVEAADDGVVVVDDLLDVQFGDRPRVLVQRLDLAFQPGQLGARTRWPWPS